MKIGIIGTGNMGRSLGLVWAERSHEVFFGARDPAKAKAAADLAVELSGDTEAGQRHSSNAQAARFGDVLLYTARGVPPPRRSAKRMPTYLLAGKIVIDMNNQELPGDFVFPPIIRSLAETLADLAPGARVIKAFNTMAQEVFELCPDAIRPHRVSVFVAGDDTDARKTVMGLAQEIGFVPVDCGALAQARLLEAAGDLIRLLMIGRKIPDANFSLAHVPDVEHPRLGGRQSSELK